MAGRIRVLRAEAGTERVDLGQRLAVALDVQLPGDGEVSQTAKQLLVEVDLAVGRMWQLLKVEGRHGEGLARPLGVAAGDDRGVDPEEAVLVEVAVNGEPEAGPQSGNGAEGVRARPQVGDLPQVPQA